VWVFAAAVSIFVVVGLFFAAARVAVHTVDRAGVNCGSVVKPLDVEVVGPAGTNPRPCEGSHSGDLGITLTCLVTSGLVLVAVVRSRPRRRGERETEVMTAA
jgi:hypothetical protein